VSRIAKNKTGITLLEEEPNRSQALATTMPASMSADKLPKIPGRGHHTEKSRLARLEWIRHETGAELRSLQTNHLPVQRLINNIENLIGGVEIPVGLAGPLWVNGQHVHGFVFAPFATTEGALVASASRGATAISRSGGVTTQVVKQQMMRVPLFVFPNMHAANIFVNWIRTHKEQIREQTQLVSQHAVLANLQECQFGNMVHLSFLYETGDAAGQNMTTVCTWKACQWILQEMKRFADVEMESFIIDANRSSDKKVSFQSFITGRGIRVMAECVIQQDVLEQVLKVSPKQLELCHQRLMQGGMSVGMVGYNINVANTIAAIYTATGQDIACVHESSLGQLHIQTTDEGLYASLLLPGLIIGTVGGGTHLPNQQDLLDLMGCAGAGKVSRLAEIIAGFCLALDLSTLSAITSGQFVSAHERHGRNRPVQWFTKADLTPSFFEESLKRVHKDPDLSVVHVQPLAFEMGSSIITELTARKVQKLVGFLPLQLRFRRGNATESRLDVLAKVKPLDEEVITMINSMAGMCGGQLARYHSQFCDRTGFKDCHIRELAVYEQTDRRFVRHTPRIYRCFRDDAREAYVIIMEKLENMVLMDSADDTSAWTKEAIEAALRGISEMHAIWLNREEELKQQPWLGPVMTSADMAEMSELWEALGVHAAEEFPELVSQEDLCFNRRIVNTLAEWWKEIERMPRTLIHNDFNPRNIAFRRLENDSLRLCAYDWELATLHLPQHDLAELLSFVLTPDVTKQQADHYVELHRKELEKASGQSLDREMWRHGYKLCLMDLMVNRVALYLMAHTFHHYPFMQRVVRTLQRLMSLETDQ
jgi:NADP-dependent 3-hydroxy-3-methylglutaryl-CoA reductase